MGKQLFTVAEAATLIANATGEHKFDVAKCISDAGRLDVLPFYNLYGKATHWQYGVYAITSDGPDSPLRFSNNGRGRYTRVDIYEVLEALEYHPEIQAKILADINKPTLISDDGLSTQDLANTNQKKQARPADNQWSLRKAERQDTLSIMILKVLKAAHANGEPIPKARDVMERIEKESFPDFVGLTNFEIKYYDNDGNVSSASTAAVRMRIGRLKNKNGT